MRKPHALYWLRFANDRLAHTPLSPARNERLGRGGGGEGVGFVSQNRPPTLDSESGTTPERSRNGHLRCGTIGTVFSLSFLKGGRPILSSLLGARNSRQNYQILRFFSQNPHPFVLSRWSYVLASHVTIWLSLLSGSPFPDS